MELFWLWVGLTSALATVGGVLDSWLDEDRRIQLTETLAAKLTRNPKEWFHSVEGAFLSLFDYFYGWRKPELNRIIWKAILFSYLALATARLVLFIFQMHTPPMDAILLTAFICALGLAFILHSGFATMQLGKSPDDASLKVLLRNRNVLSSVFLSGIAVAMYSAAMIMAAKGVGLTNKNVAVISMGAGICVPLAALVFRVKDNIIAVAPLRAIVSTLMFIALLVFMFPGASKTFIPEFNKNGPLILVAVAFNIFGDALSLVETRWLLQLSRGRPLLGILGILLLDLVLSALIYMIMPWISGLDWHVFSLAVRFEGPMPWIGILFWSTFFTSFLFYLFVASILLVRCIEPLARLLNVIDPWFKLYQHPVRLITVAMVIVETIGFVVIEFWKFLSG